MSRRYLRPGVLVGHLLVLVAVLTCLRLGWWQWNVTESTRGTVQNLGYALLWPVFAGAFIYMWLRFLHLETIRDAELEQLADGEWDGDGDGDVGHDGEDGVGDAAGRVALSTGRSTGSDGPNCGGPVTAGADPAATLDGGTPAEARPDRPRDRASGGDSAAVEAAVHETPETAVIADASGTGPARNGRRPRRTRRPPTEVYTIAVATVGEDDEDDPELAAYNRALAALAEQDRRRAR